MELDRTIVCFFCDEAFGSMVVAAITTLLQATPRISVGLLTQSRPLGEEILQQLPPDLLARVIHRSASTTPYFERWNPTQYKLDIAKFVDFGCFDQIFWMDGDTLTFEDMTPLFQKFAQDSSTQFLLIPDHVNYDREFQALWTAQRGEAAPTIPQACFMGFKTGILKEFFGMWRAEWEEWCVPAAFARHPDPRPHFPGSAFCVEQYALGIALHRYSKAKDAVCWIERKMIEIPRSKTASQVTLPATVVTDPTTAEQSSACTADASQSSSSYYITTTTSCSIVDATSCSYFVSLVSLDGLGSTRTNNPNFVLIDMFPGFYHYYHENKVSAFEWWKSTHR